MFGYKTDSFIQIYTITVKRKLEGNPYCQVLIVMVKWIQVNKSSVHIIFYSPSTFWGKRDFLVQPRMATPTAITANDRQAPANTRADDTPPAILYEKRVPLILIRNHV